MATGGKSRLGARTILRCFYEIPENRNQKIGTWHELGLGNRTGINLPGEKVEFSYEWKLAHHGKVWTYNRNCGCGDWPRLYLATPLQLAVMTARIANGRKAVIPRLLTND